MQFEYSQNILHFNGILGDDHKWHHHFQKERVSKTDEKVVTHNSRKWWQWEKGGVKNLKILGSSFMESPLHHHLNSKYIHVNKQFVFVLYVLRLLACFTLEIQCINQLYIARARINGQYIPLDGPFFWINYLFPSMRVQQCTGL